MIPARFTAAFSLPRLAGNKDECRGRHNDGKRRRSCPRSG
jgi:hypothetical protein